MSLFDSLLHWVKGPPEPPTDIHRQMRKAVHESRNMATVAIAEAKRSEKTSNRICQVAQQVIKRLEAARQESDECED